MINKVRGYAHINSNYEKEKESIYRYARLLLVVNAHPFLRLCPPFGDSILALVGMLVLTLLLLFLSILYFYLKSVYFILRGSIPGIPSQFVFGNLIQAGLISWRSVSIPDRFVQLSHRLGDVFQFWSGPTRIIVLCRLEDVQHVFAHRHIYDQGKIFTEKFKLFNPNGIIGLTGTLFPKAREYCSSDKIIVFFRGPIQKAC